MKILELINTWNVWKDEDFNELKKLQQQNKEQSITLRSWGDLISKQQKRIIHLEQKIKKYETI
ncbi:MAG: hypothetical protein GY793_01760 [Proteobacteria bacterium]|nr:hypothetical protein [Pseudomonadota bacterium]